uniref:Putative lipoate-protein ligase a n=1 Tax=Xenopsylla cheopis TaxID=163159 RepID=A0A6M2DSQ5_XENCH
MNSCYSTKQNVKDVNEKDIQKSVFISQSNDIFTNLAMEDWIYRNYDLTNHHIMMLWLNDPCVVIGRHQNPWKEADVSAAEARDIKVARRNSGGGTVYHDKGNLNMTFFTPRERYNRKYNLNIITRALFREWGIRSMISPREDIVLEGNLKQISGTAAKLGQPNAYHHCTLLVNVDKLNLTQVLHTHESGISTTATPSVRSKVANLVEQDVRVNINRLLEAVGNEYMRTSAISLQDEGDVLKQTQRGFQSINPTEGWFPGLNKIREEYESWDWRFGRTPKFSVSRIFDVPDNLLGDFVEQNIPKMEQDSKQLTISMNVERGLINDVHLSVPKGLCRKDGMYGEAAVITRLQGQKFSEESMKLVEIALAGEEPCALQEKEKFVANCFRKIINSA